MDGKSADLIDHYDYLGLIQQPAMLPGMFSAGTPIRVPGGSQLIEKLKVGDEVLSRDEFEAAAPVTSQRIEEIFIREALVWKFRLGGQVISTTAEHPFFRSGE